MKRLLMVMLLILVIFPTYIYADIGPKPSIHINFENMGDEVCYGTLLSKGDTTGPASAWDGKQENIRNHDDVDMEIWKAFVDYEDIDNFYYLQRTWKVSEEKTLDWTYYPPNTFKILLYYPENNTFVVSPIYETYAFDSYYSVDMESFYTGEGVFQAKIVDNVDNKPEMEAEKNYNYGKDIGSFAVRVVLTILVELILAYIIGFREKSVVKVIMITNLITQIGLNLALSIVNYNSGSLAVLLIYIPLEILVFVVETIIYLRRFNKVSSMPIAKTKIVSYGFFANALSYGIGLWLALYVPWIF